MMATSPLTESPSLWLATGSPRRRALLEQAGYGIAGRVRPAMSVDETLAPQEPAEAAALRLADRNYRRHYCPGLTWRRLPCCWPPTRW